MKYNLTKSLKLFFENTLHLILIYILLIFVLNIFRTVILVFFNSSPDIYKETSDIIRAYAMGFRFDTVVICYGLLPVMILNLAGIFLYKIDKYYSVINKICRSYYTALALIFIFISVIDLYFYNYFTTRISILIFGFIEDDTSAVIKSIWTDYPVIHIVIGLIFAAWGSYKLISIIQKIDFRKTQLSFKGNIAFVLIISCMFVFALRGSFGANPIKMNELIVSNSVFINNLVPNGIYALKTAFKLKKINKIDTNIAHTMKKWNFSSLDEAVSTYTGRIVPNNTDSLKAILMAHTPKDDFLEQNPPNVIFIQMESMSEHFISLHNKENFNMLGTLEDAMDDCVHFTHFLQSTDGTIQTLETIMLNSPISPISQSTYLDRTLETSVAKPFKEKGYKTIYLTGNKLGWRNLHRFIPNQYFDEIEGDVHLEKKLSGVELNDWGTYDEFMFERMFDMLNENPDHRKFIFGMTTTNHTPCELPDTYKPYPVQIPNNLKDKLASDEEYALKHFTTYQYANDCLGKFIQKVKSSPLGENTIIVATGDHCARRVFDYSDAQMLQKYAVPLLLYIPEKYKSRFESPDTNQFGSHKDIFPTIYHLALSDATYVKSGVNLFDKTALSVNFAISGYKLVMNNQGCVYYDTKPVYYVWADSEKTELKPASKNDITGLNQLMIYGKSYTASMTYLIQQYLSEDKRDIK